MTGLIIIAATLACAFPASRLYSRHLLTRRAHTGASTIEDVQTVLKHWHHNRLPVSTKARLLYACRDAHYLPFEQGGLSLWTTDGYVDYTDTNGLTGIYSPTAITRWLLDRHSTSLLLICFDAGLSSKELLDHCDGTSPITYEQAEMLAAFRTSNF